MKEFCNSKFWSY